MRVFASVVQAMRDFLKRFADFETSAGRLNHGLLVGAQSRVLSLIGARIPFELQ